MSTRIALFLAAMALPLSALAGNLPEGTFLSRIDWDPCQLVVLNPHEVFPSIKVNGIDVDPERRRLLIAHDGALPFGSIQQRFIITDPKYRVPVEAQLPATNAPSYRFGHYLPSGRIALAGNLGLQVWDRQLTSPLSELLTSTRLLPNQVQSDIVVASTPLPGTENILVRWARSNHQIELWDTKTSTRIASLSANDDKPRLLGEPINFLPVSDDGKYFFTTTRGRFSRDRSNTMVILRYAIDESGHKISFVSNFEVPAGPRAYEALSVSRDGTQVLVTDYYDHAKLYDWATHEELAHIDTALMSEAEREPGKRWAWSHGVLSPGKQIVILAGAHVSQELIQNIRTGKATPTTRGWSALFGYDLAKGKAFRLFGNEGWERRHREVTYLRFTDRYTVLAGFADGTAAVIDIAKYLPKP